MNLNSSATSSLPDVKYKSKVDWWLHLVFGGLVIVNIWMIVAVPFSSANDAIPILIITLLILTPVNLATVPMWLNTYYLFTKDGLRVRSGFFVQDLIEYERIISIRENRNQITQMTVTAIAYDRMEITYRYKRGNFTDSVFVSPKDKQEFIDELKKRSENVEVLDRVPMSKGNKALLIVGLGILAAVLIGMGITFIVGAS